MGVQFAIRLSLIAFATASIRGLLNGDDFQGTIQGALVALAVFYGLGLIFGEWARRLVEDNARHEITRLKAKNANSES